jgi:outer membrane protein assembly factor BamB
VICLLTRDAMTAIDPVTGRTLWTRTDVNSRSTVFGDDQNIYVVGMGEGNSATGTRAFRAYDGVTVRVRDFTNEYQNRVRMLGRNILVAETDVKNVLKMRIYDVLTGRTPWEQKFAPGSVQLRSEDPNLAGAVEPDGTVRIVDLRSTKEVMKGKMRWGKMSPKELSSAKGVYLVSDPTAVYIAVNGPNDPNVGGGPPGWVGVPGTSTVQPMLSAGYGLRALPVNGDVYAFNRASGKLLWVNEYASSTMTLTHFEDMPAIVFTARYQKRLAGGPGFNVQQYSAIQAVHKRTGKALLHKEDGNLGVVNFHAVQMDPRTGKFEFLSTQLKVTVQVARTDK